MTNVGYQYGHKSHWLQKPPLGVQLNWAHPLTKGLVGCWLFNEGGGDKAYDLSGYNNHGTLNNMAFPPTTASGWNPGKDGVGLNFDGSNGYVNCHKDVSFTLTDFTIEAWIKTSVLSRNILNNYLGATPKNFYALMTDASGYAKLFVRDTSAKTGLVIGNTTVSDENWHHVVGVRDANTKVYIYVDGKFENDESDNTVGAIAPNDENYIGCAPNLDFPFNGLIDGVKIYNRVLNAEEIQQLYMTPYYILKPATKYTIIDERLATDYVGGNVMAAELI